MKQKSASAIYTKYKSVLQLYCESQRLCDIYYITGVSLTPKIIYFDPKFSNSTLRFCQAGLPISINKESNENSGENPDTQPSYLPQENYSSLKTVNLCLGCLWNNQWNTVKKGIYNLGYMKLNITGIPYQMLSVELSPWSDRLHTSCGKQSS